MIYQVVFWLAKLEYILSPCAAKLQFFTQLLNCLLIREKVANDCKIFSTECVSGQAPKKLILRIIWDFLKPTVNPIPMGLIFNYFRIGLDAPPSKIGPNQARKLLKTVLESSQKMMGCIICTQKVPSTWLKSIKRFFMFF